MLHLIDDAGRLKAKEEIVQFLNSTLDSVKEGNAKESTSLASIGSNYHVVGVLGAQSSGKSTLLNHLFGTKFEMLDETVRRGQTTKGVFLSCICLQSNADSGRAESLSPLLVVDFEGTDGLERGEDQSFERQLSLFALCMADTLILNMWAVDVGRFNAANMSLLRTIFEINLQLFSHEGYEKEEKPTLLVVFRDFTERDLKPSILTLRKSFDTIWENVIKPPRFSQSSIEDLFSFKYFAMPHLKLQHEEFLSHVSHLQRWFVNPSSENYLFNHQTMFRGVLLEDLPSYLISCWDTICTSRDLDIPTQREMLAHHRCKDAKATLLKDFEDFCLHCEQRVCHDGAVLPFSSSLEEKISTLMEEYRSQTKLYRSDVVTLYSDELEEEILSIATKLLARVCAPISANVLNALEKTIQNVVDNSMNRLLKSAQALSFVTHSTGKGTSDSDLAGAGSSAIQTWPVPKSDLAMDGNACKGFVLTFWKELVSEVAQILGEVSSDSASTHLFGRYAALIREDTEAKACVVSLVTKSVLNKLKLRMSSMSENASETIHRGFMYCLSHNANGTVRVFSTPKGLTEAVPAAEQAGLVQLGCFLYFRLGLCTTSEWDAVASEGVDVVSHPLKRCVRVNQYRPVVRQNDDEQKFFLKYTTIHSCPKYPYDVAIKESLTDDDDLIIQETGVVASCIMLNQSALDRAFEMYKQKCEFTMQLELRSIEAGRQRLPAWVIPAICILGFNEFWYVITSPILLVTIIFIIFFFFKGLLINQWRIFEETAPSMVVTPLKMLFTRLSAFYFSIVPPSLVLPNSTNSTVCNENGKSRPANNSKTETTDVEKSHSRVSDPVYMDPVSTDSQASLKPIRNKLLKHTQKEE